MTLRSRTPQNVCSIRQCYHKQPFPCYPPRPPGQEKCAPLPKSTAWQTCPKYSECVVRLCRISREGYRTHPSNVQAREHADTLLRRQLTGDAGECATLS